MGVIQIRTPSAVERRGALPELSARQLRLAFLQAGYSPHAIETHLRGIADDTQRETSLIEWEYGTVFGRSAPLVEAIRSALKITDEQVDSIWRAGTLL